MIISKNEKEAKRRGHEQAPLLEKSVLLKYLYEGEIDRSYKEGNIPIVSADKLSILLLEAGYTEIALSRSFSGTHTDLKRSERFPQSEQDKLILTIHSRNRYGLKPNVTYDAVDAVSWAVSLSKPDLPEGKDNLRAMVLQQLKELEILKAKLRKSGKRFIALSSWSFNLKGEVVFWLNPRNQKIYNSGWFTLDNLNLWLNNNRSSPVFNKKKGDKTETRKIKGRNNFREEYERAMKTHSYSNQRLLKISLMGCPFPDLVDQYSSEDS